MSQPDCYLDTDIASTSSIAPARSGALVILDPESFYRTHAPRLHAAARRILKDPELARDAVQDACISIFRHIGEFRGDSSLETWMTRIVMNAALGYVRRSRCRPATTPLEDEETGGPVTRLFDSGPSPLELTSREEIRQRIREGLERLRPKHREVILRHDLGEENIESIAEDLGLPVGTIKSRLFYGRQQLRLALTRKEDRIRTA